MHVLERGGEVLGMVESMLRVLPDDGVPGMLPPGRYAYLNSVGVRADARGRGLGRALAAAAAAAHGELDGSTLWFALYNPISSRVWPHLGWRPLWTLWERRAGVSVAPSR